MANPTTRVIHFPAQGQAELTTDPMPVCGPGQMIIHTEFSGVSNGTERSFLVGGPYGGSRWPCRCGYQIVGRVVEVGEQVKAYAIGDRVFCGTFRHHAEYFLVDAADAEADTHITVKLPDAIDPTHAALFGVGGVSFHDSRRCGVKLGDRVLVVGAGVIGQFAAQAARAAGAEVTVVNRGSDRLEIARACGAQHTFAIESDESWQALRGRGFDVCIEDSGADILHELLGTNPGRPGVLRYGGKLFLCAGRHQVTYNCMAAQSQGIELLHASHFKRQDLLQLTRLTAEGVVRVAPLIRDVVPVEQAPAIYARMRDDPRSLLGTVFQWR